MTVSVATQVTEIKICDEVCSQASVEVRFIKKYSWKMQTLKL